VVINPNGERLLSRRVANDESELPAPIGDVLEMSVDALWAVDLDHGGAALLIGMPVGHDQPVAYLTGLAVHRAAATYKGGEGKTDAKDAFVIADQARVRRDPGLLRPGEEIAVDLRILTTRRPDAAFDRTRQINRLHAQLLEIFPALWRSLELTNRGPVMLSTGYRTPAAIRRAGTGPIETWLKKRKVRGASAVAKTAVEAAWAQQAALPGEKTAATMVARLAKGVMALDEEIAELDALIEATFHEHPRAEVVRSLPGTGPKLGTGFLAATGGARDAFGGADRPAGFVGLAPRPRDSRRVSGNLRRPRRHRRGLLRTMYLSAMVSLQSCPVSKALHDHDRKRSEGKGHQQALPALARRRLNVLRAMIRDGEQFHTSPPVTLAAWHHDWEVPLFRGRARKAPPRGKWARWDSDGPSLWCLAGPTRHLAGPAAFRPRRRPEPGWGRSPRGPAPIGQTVAFIWARAPTPRCPPGRRPVRRPGSLRFTPRTTGVPFLRIARTPRSMDPEPRALRDGEARRSAHEPSKAVRLGFESIAARYPAARLRPRPCRPDHGGLRGTSDTGGRRHRRRFARTAL